MKPTQIKFNKQRHGGSFIDPLIAFWTEKTFTLLMIGLLFVFILYPVLCLLKISLEAENGISLWHYRNLLRSNRTVIYNSLFSSTLTAVFSTMLSLAVALRISTAKGWLKNLLMTVLLITTVSPPFVSSLAYIQLYGRRGWITSGILGLSLNPYNWRGVVVMQILGFAPVGTLLLLGMLEKVDKSLIQSARTLGAGPNIAVLNVMLPLILPGIIANLLLSFIRALTDFGTPIVIGGRFNTIASEIYMQIIGYASLNKAAALNMLIFIPSVFAFIAYRILMKRSGTLLGSSFHSGASDNLDLKLKGLLSVALNIVAGIFLLAMSLQYLCIFASGFLKSIKGKYFFTIEHLERLIKYDLSALVRSIQYALAVAVLGTLFSMLLAYYVERRKGSFRNGLDFIATMPYIIPGTCFGLGYILAFNSAPLKLTGTAAIVIINMMFRQLPNTTKLCSAYIAQIPYALEDAARSLGAGRLSVIKDIIIPNLNRAFFTGFVYNFTSAMTTAGAVLFLIHPKQKIAVFRLFDAINTGDYGVASLISTIIVIISLAVSLVLMWLTGGKGKGGVGYALEDRRAE